MIFGGVPRGGTFPVGSRFGERREVKDGNGEEIMDAMQMAGHLSLEFGAVVEGPWDGPHDGDRVARVWLPNKRGVSLLWHAETDEIDMITIRETVPVRGKDYDGTPWRTDQTTPVVNGGECGQTTLEIAQSAVRILRDLPEIDPRDQRSTLRY